jgi:hypothetical protein
MYYSVFFQELAPRVVETLNEDKQQLTTRSRIQRRVRMAENLGLRPVVDDINGKCPATSLEPV